MGRQSLYFGAAALTAIAVLLVHGAESAAVRRSRLQQHRNLGKAYYESVSGSDAAVAEFRLAVDLAPDSFRDRLNYGMALLRAGQIKEFDSRGLPTLPPGWNREFLFLVDGWSKDADANTAHSESVEPLPFHGMRSYPYPPGEHFPSSPAHQAYRRMYNTRRELPVMPSLAQNRRFD